tara:strand:+ start:52 stop:336 length:285 start_codon:yes stop_codon:yes gene_type:complete
MKKISLIIFFNFFLISPVFAWCEFGGLLDWSKEHKACGKYARDLEKKMKMDEFDTTDAYCACRIRLYNLETYGVEKIQGADEYRNFPGLRSVKP